VLKRPPLPVEVRTDDTAKTGNLVAAVAALLLSRARKKIAADNSLVSGASIRPRGRPANQAKCTPP
jgi:hypothetical protein